MTKPEIHDLIKHAIAAAEEQIADDMGPGYELFECQRTELICTISETVAQLLDKE